MKLSEVITNHHVQVYLEERIEAARRSNLTRQVNVLMLTRDQLQNAINQQAK